MAFLEKLSLEPMTPDIVSPAVNKANTMMVMEKWKLGPEKPSERPGDNAPYWKEMAVAWQTSEKEARRQRCANCEYFNNTVEMAEAMESIPFNKFDENAGGRGYCHKFEFICHDLRSCLAWEARDYEIPEED